MLAPGPATTRIAPTTSSTAASAAETHGLAKARPTTPRTVTSSALESTMLLTGSGEVLTAARAPALTRWAASAVNPPVAAVNAASSEELSWPKRYPRVAPTAGRMTVWTESHIESR